MQSEDVADARRARRHPFGLLFLEFEKIEIVAAIFLFFGSGKDFFGSTEQRKTRRQRERFLRAGKQDVDSELVHFDLHRGKRRNGVDDERDIWIFRERAGDFRQRIHNAGRRFVVNQRDGVEFSGRKSRIDVFLIDVLAPVDLERFGALAATPGDIEPLV